MVEEDVATVTGRVIRYDEPRGYGFIAPDHGAEDVFAHVNDLEMDRSLFVPGMKVAFEVAEGDRGLKATRVRPAPDSALVETAAPVTQPPATPVAATASAGQDDTLCDVLTIDELEHELTEALLENLPDLAGRDVLAIRELVVKIASGHQWVEA